MTTAINRRLGATEQALWLRDQSVPLHFALTAQVRGTLGPQQLTSALARLQQCHPLLRVKIDLDEQGYPTFVEQVAPIPYQRLPRQDDHHWQRQAAQVLTQPFDWRQAPLLRLVWLESPEVSELILVCHHAIADGLAAVNLLAALLTDLGQSSPPLPPRSQPFPLEALLSGLPPIRKHQILLAKTVLAFKQWGKQWGQKLKQRFTHGHHPAAALAPSALAVQAGALSPVMTQTIIHRCHQEGTTVHAALCTALLLAVGKTIPSVDLAPASPTAVSCFCPINLRPYLQTSMGEACGSYIAPIKVTVSSTVATEGASVDFWQQARAFKGQLTDQMNPPDFAAKAQQNRVLMATQPTPALVQQIFLDHCVADVMVTNLGQVAIAPDFGHLSLTALYGPMVLSGFSTERVLGIITLGNQLFFTFVHQPPGYLDSTLAIAEPTLAEQALHILTTHL